MNFGLHLTDCIAHMRTMPAASVHLIVCDSPYENTNLAFDKQPVNWAAWWAEVRRVLVPTGVVVCFAAESFTLDLILSNREWYRYRRVWVKSRATRQMDANWRPLCAHEDLVIFSPNIKAASYNPQLVAHQGPNKSTRRKPNAAAHYSADKGNVYTDNGLRHPTTVMYYPSVGTTALHFNPTAKPLGLITELVLTYSNPGEVVLEPFAGDAPAAHACENTGRLYVGCEINPEQYHWSAANLARKAPLFAAA
ncbi:site-specific DNA-methyltransferase [Hymenobacter sp. 15J16-1T3B]|uniref:DNA-methyltransferase n=1 Tax=Hymenobacter sp. 15J16-1T3B TaxID=2886941 RepID=UPI001D0F8A33|nr:site-specific DNA-methyltransferase [Hymenobacter sp. 15J16-1T3B]MCC3159709.1 site-specific DNA-methyltransferase [Hymenobacter sp. 15J16-1T3B]